MKGASDSVAMPDHRRVAGLACSIGPMLRLRSPELGEAPRSSPAPAETPVTVGPIQHSFSLARACFSRSARPARGGTSCNSRQTGVSKGSQQSDDSRGPAGRAQAPMHHPFAGESVHALAYVVPRPRDVPVPPCAWPKQPARPCVGRSVLRIQPRRCQHAALPSRHRSRCSRGQDCAATARCAREQQDSGWRVIHGSLRLEVRIRAIALPAVRKVRHMPHGVRPVGQPAVQKPVVKGQA